MANRTQKSKKIQKIDIDSDFNSQDLLPSQESEPSEAEHHRKLVAALNELRKKDKAEKEKKSEKQKRFLQVTEKHLDRELTQAASIIEDTVKAVEVVYNTFMSKYAVQEDKIYDLWTQIQNEQANLADMVNAKYERKKKAIANAASAHLTALSSMNSACNESRKVIDSLIPPSVSDSDSDFDMSDGDN